MNSIYNVMFGLRRIELKPEVRAYKTTMKMYVPTFETVPSDKLKMELTITRDWYFKNGAFKKLDVQNMAKVLIDLVAEKMGFCDSQVWDVKMEKVHSETESFVYVKLHKINGGPQHGTKI